MSVHGGREAGGFTTAAGAAAVALPAKSVAPTPVTRVQIWWDNTLYGGLRVIARRVVAWALYILLLCVALAVQTWLAVLAKQEAEDNQDQRTDDGRAQDEDGAEDGAKGGAGNFDVRCSKPPCYSIPSLRMLCMTRAVLPRQAMLRIARVKGGIASAPGAVSG